MLQLSVNFHGGYN